MSLAFKLTLCFGVFLLLIAAAMVASFRERQRVRRIHDDDLVAQQASDARILMVLFGAILGGMITTLLVAWIVFFS